MASAASMSTFSLALALNFCCQLSTSISWIRSTSSRADCYAAAYCLFPLLFVIGVAFASLVVILP